MDSHLPRRTGITGNKNRILRCTQNDRPLRPTPVAGQAAQGIRDRS